MCSSDLTVYPYSKLNPQRVSAMIKRYGAERITVNGSADWGVSDPLALIKTVDYMRQDGHDEATIEAIVFQNAMRFYSSSPNWKPNFNLQPVDPSTYQR